MCLSSHELNEPIVIFMEVGSPWPGETSYFLNQPLCEVAPCGSGLCGAPSSCLPAPGSGVPMIVAVASVA